MPSPTDAPASLPAQIAAAEGELPEEIEKAIEAFNTAAHRCGMYVGQPEFGSFTRSSVLAKQSLTDTILARLTAAESAREVAVAERDEARANLDKLEDTMAPLSDDGKCVWIDGSGAVPLDFSQGRDLAAALARAERAEKALEDLKGSFHEDSDAYAKITAALAHPAPAEET